MRKMLSSDARCVHNWTTGGMDRAGSPVRACGLFTPNSPLFACAEVCSRRCEAQLFARQRWDRQMLDVPVYVTVPEGLFFLHGRREPGATGLGPAVEIHGNAPGPPAASNKQRRKEK